MRHHNLGTQISTIILTIAISGLLFFGIGSCGSGDNADESEMAWCRRKTDTLWLFLNQTRKEFRYRMDEINERKTEMEKNMQFLRFHEPENAGQEAISLIQQYNSVLMVYKRSGPEYKNAVLETEDLFYRLKVLDRELKKGTYKGHLPRFKKDWAVLYAELMKNQEETREVTMHLSQIEPMYLRISPRIEEWVSKAQK